MKVLIGSAHGHLLELVDHLAEVGCHVERLQQAVHVACGALVLQSLERFGGLCGLLSFLFFSFLLRRVLLLFGGCCL